MKTVSVTIDLPVDVIADAVGPKVLRALRQERVLEPPKAARREPAETLFEAAKSVAASLTAYESSAGTRDERRALRRLIAASTGVRNALNTLKTPFKD